MRTAPAKPEPVATATTDEPPADMSDLDAKLAEIAAQYDDLQAELSRPGGEHRSERDPPTRSGAGATRAHRGGVSVA